MSGQDNLYYFIELYVKIKTEILNVLLDELVKQTKQYLNM